MSTTTTMSFADEVRKFQSVRESFAEWGACDTEPRWVFAELVRATYEGKEVEIPTTATGWQLYSGMRGVGLAAAALTRAARRAITAARQDTLGVARYIRDTY